jgi:hypothetical protein
MPSVRSPFGKAGRAILVLAVIALLLISQSAYLRAQVEQAPVPQPAPVGAPIHLQAGTFTPTQGETLAIPQNLSIPGYPPGQPGYYIVQFSGPIQGEWKARVSDLGAVLLEYIPDGAFIVYIDDVAKGQIETLPEVVWIGLYQPAYKLSPELYTAQGILDLVVLTFPTEPVNEISSQVEAMGAQVQDTTSTGRFGGLLRLTLDAANLPDLARIPAVHWIEPFYERELFSDVARSDQAMDAETVWASLGLYGEGQIVAVSDTGLDVGDLDDIHNDFRGNPTGCSGTDRIVATFARARPGDWSDSCRCRYIIWWIYYGGHGTHVSGSVLGNGCQSGSDGTPDYGGSYAGVAPQAGLVFQSVMGPGGGSCGNSNGCALTGLPLDLNDLYAQAQGAGAHLHTNSWGAAVGGQYTIDARNTDVYMWDHPEYTILFSAGNSGIDSDANGVVDLDSIGAPGTAKNCITVGASENYRLSGGYNPGGLCYTWYGCWEDDYPVYPIADDLLSDDLTGIAAFSSRGPLDDGRIKPDLVAPGTNILSVRSQGQYVEGWGDGPNQYYLYMGGTSMSTPLTAGATALVREYFTDQGLTPSAALLKATLIHGATDISPGQYGTGLYQEIPNPPRPNNVEGWGRVNLVGSLLPGGARRIEYFDYFDAYDPRRPGLRTGEYDSWTYEVTDSSVPFMSTLVWTDFAASTSAAVQLVNDLDLTITDPDATVHYPNGGAAADRTNNVEGIDLPNPIPIGNYTVRIEGYNVAEEGTVPRQTYAAVDSGVMGDVVSAESLRSMPAGDQPEMTFGKTGMDVDFASGPGGDITVTMNRAAPANPPPEGTTFVNLDWNIATVMAGTNAQLVFSYDEGDLPSGMTEEQIGGAYRWDSEESSWEWLGGTVDTAANTVTVDGVTEFSNWALGSSPTAVKLVRFEAWLDGGAVHLEWETSTEIDNVGFDLYRSDASGGDYIRLNEVRIPSKAPGSPAGALYTWQDETVVAGIVYHYMLEDVDVHGKRTQHGPLSVLVTESEFAVYLPLVSR